MLPLLHLKSIGHNRQIKPADQWNFVFCIGTHIRIHWQVWNLFRCILIFDLLAAFSRQFKKWRRRNKKRHKKKNSQTKTSFTYQINTNNIVASILYNILDKQITNEAMKSPSHHRETYTVSYWNYYLRSYIVIVKW